MLADFRRWVLELSIGSSPSGPTLSNILIEAVAEIREALWDRYRAVAPKIARDKVFWSDNFIIVQVHPFLVQAANKK
jgi:hypothetical protein